MKRNNGCKDRDAKVKKSSSKLVTKVSIWDDYHVSMIYLMIKIKHRHNERRCDLKDVLVFSYLITPAGKVLTYRHRTGQQPYQICKKKNEYRVDKGVEGGS